MWCFFSRGVSFLLLLWRPYLFSQFWTNSRPTEASKLCTRSSVTIKCKRDLILINTCIIHVCILFYPCTFLTK
ncbi:hypothetical protein F4814DRAFT_410444 [Daldinia grandis]|nr:hypothetical protein F4814DRAFT_410444 [Daldinia grandis]